MFLEVVLPRRKYGQNCGYSKHAKNQKATSDKGVSERHCNITLIRKRHPT